MMRMAPEAVAAVLGASTTAAAGTPVAGIAAQHMLLLPALKAILDDQAEEQNRLTRANIEALVNGPYETGMEYLNQAAQEHRKAEERKEYVREAFREFMRAHGQQKHKFRSALIEYQLGNSCALLGKKEDARQWYQRSYTSAVNHLYDYKTKVQYLKVEFQNWLYSPVDYAHSAWIWRGRGVIQSPLVLKSKQRRTTNEFLEEGPSVLDLIEDLKRLQEKTRKKLDLEFPRVPDPHMMNYDRASKLPTNNTRDALKKWLVEY